MCWQCDNPSGDFTAHLIDVIDECGWAVSGVEASATNPGWLYTVGLPARFGHPELVIAGASIARPWSSSTIRSQIHRP